MVAALPNCPTDLSSLSLSPSVSGIGIILQHLPFSQHLFFNYLELFFLVYLRLSVNCSVDLILHTEIEGKNKKIAMAGAVEIVSLQLTEGVQDLTILDQTDMKDKCTAVVEEFNQEGCSTNKINIDIHHGVCAICLNKIALQETALVKGCEHAYCVTCILRWASCKKEPTCPQCKCPFEFLNVHRGLDGSIHDYMFEESVCLLLRASWFKPLVELVHEEALEEIEDYYYDDDEEEDLDEVYLGSSSSVRIGNRRWGDNGYVRAGRQEARPVHHPSVLDSGAGPSRQHKKKDTPSKELVGRRAKRALKREAADKAAAAKHQQHLARLGRK